MCVLPGNLELLRARAEFPLVLLYLILKSDLSSMRDAKNLLAATTLLLLCVASYMRLTETVVKARYSTGKGASHWHTGYDSANSIFLCAILTGAVWCFVFWMSRQRS